MVKMGDVWDRALEFLGDHLGVLMPLVLLGMFVPTTISGSLQELQATGGPGLKLALGIMTLAFGILSLWTQLAIVALAVDPALGRRATGVATARLLPAMGVYVLLGIAAFVLVLPAIILLAAGGFDFAAAQAGQMGATKLSAGYGLAIFLYMLVVVAAILGLGARLAPVTAVIVAERRGAGAIGRAFALTRGLTWRLIGVVVLYAVVTLVAVLAAQTVFGSILGLVAGGDGPITVARVITAIVVAAVSTGFSVIAAAFCAKLYVAILRARESAMPSPESIARPS
ncbi:MAG: hypothetical protein V4537_15185 [Pseudomonadota bacterium]